MSLAMRFFLPQPFACLLLLIGAYAGAQMGPSGPVLAQVQRWMQEGSQAMQQGRTGDAVELFHQAAMADPAMPEAYLGLGLAQLRSGQIAEAEASLRRVIELDPRAPGPHMFLGIAQYQSGDAAAASNLQQELLLQPDSVEALTWLGIIELAAGDPVAAATPLDHAATLAPKNASVLYYRGRAHSGIAEQTYKAMYKLDPDSALVHRALGESFSSSGQPEKAVAEFQRAIAKQPNDADLYEDLGNEDQKLSRFDAATAAYEQELKLNPSSAVALYNLGKMRVERGSPEAGVALLRRAVAAHGTPAPNAFYLGLGLAETGQNEEAAQWLERSLGSDPSPFIEQSAYFQLARVYARLGRKEASEKALERLKSLKVNSAKAITGG